MITAKSQTVTRLDSMMYHFGSHYSILINWFQIGENFEPKVILDAACSDSEIKILVNLLVDSLECR